MENREKILSLHKREMLKGLLINKFKLKYAQDAVKHPNLHNYINNEVSKFISSERLTEDNLKYLDDKIAREADTRDRKEAILEDRRSSVMPGSIFHQNRHNYLNSTAVLPRANIEFDTPKSARFDRVSHTSSQNFRSPAAEMAQNNNFMNPAPQVADSDRVSVSSSSSRAIGTANLNDRKSRRVISIASSTASSRALDKLEVFSQVGKSGKAEDDEWNAIVKFNTLLHYEEQKLA